MLMVRHGEAHCNIDGVVSEADDCQGLTPPGRVQADAVALALAIAQHNIAAVYTSPAARAVQTAVPIGEAVGAPVIPELPGPVFGQARGRAWEDVLARLDFPIELTPDTPVAPDAEPWSAWVNRVGVNLDDLADKHVGQTVVLVGHEASVQAAEQWIHRGPRSPHYRVMVVDYASITEWEQCAVGTAARRQWLWRRNRHNDIGHCAAPAHGECIRTGSFSPPTVPPRRRF
ncbi:histidine phosphatase family protein [Nocardia sp. NPDC003963]